MIREKLLRFKDHASCENMIGILGGGFKHFLFSSLPGEMIQFDWYFSNGLKPPTRIPSKPSELHVTHLVGGGETQRFNSIFFFYCFGNPLWNLVSNYGNRGEASSCGDPKFSLPDGDHRINYKWLDSGFNLFWGMQDLWTAVLYHLYGRYGRSS